MVQPKLTSLAKLTRPSADGAFPRHRLFRLIKKKLSCSILWISGSPGSGKTTLVSSYLEAHGLRGLWYQLDVSDQNLASFFYYIGLAVKQVAPRKRQSLPLLTPEYLKDIPTFTRRYFENLYNQLLNLQSDSPARFIIVFDNYQEIPEGAMLHETILQGISEVPAGVNIIFVSRRDPPGFYAPMIANRSMEMIGWDELKFNFDESKKLIRHRGCRRLPDKLLRQLHERAGGWAAGLVLLTEGMKAGGDESLLSRTDITDEIFRYFAGEIFNKTSKETQDFLLKTAFFKQMTPLMAGALTGLSRAKTILTDLSQKHYFTQKHELHYQYHPLFREFLQAQGKERFKPAKLSEIERRASAILEDHGQIKDAADLMANAGNWPALVSLILNNAPALISQGRSQTLDAWIRKMPPSQVEENPWLLYWSGVCRLPFSPEESGNYFEKAFRLFQSRRDAAGLFLSLSGRFDSISFLCDNIAEFDRLIPMMNELRREFPDSLSPEIEARVIHSMLSAISMRQPRHPDVDYWEARGLLLAESISDLERKALIFGFLGLLRTLCGELERAAVVIDSFHKAVTRPQVPPMAKVLFKLVESLHSFMSGDFKKNYKATDEGIATADATGVHMVDVFILGHGAAGALSTGDLKRADELLNRMRLCINANATAWAENYYCLLMAWKSLLQKDFLRASHLADLASKFGVRSGYALTEAFAPLMKALALHALGEEETDRYISEAHGICRNLNIYHGEFKCLLVRAQFALDLGREAEGLDLLRKAMELGRKWGYVNTYFWVPSIMARLCKKALESEIEVDYVQGLIQKRALFPDSSPYDCDRWPWPLKIFTLGTFDLVKEGEPLEFPVKAPRKMLLLLKALIASGSQGLSEERLTSDLWPEADGDMAHQAFATTLHRLRQLFGYEKAIQLRKGFLRIDGRVCWVDAHAFEHLLQQADALNEVVLLQKAIALYTGSFLGGDNSDPWAISYQEKLRSKFLRAVTKLGQFFEKNGDHEKAIECYQKGLEVDGFAEEFYQRLMLCYDVSGRKAEALSVYDRFRRRLRLVLGVEPSPKTQALYDTIRKKS